MQVNKFNKDPDAVLDYAIDWSAWLADDTIASAEAIADEGIVVESDAMVGSQHVIWISGGDVRRSYIITSRITTAAGRIDDRSLKIFVIER